MNYFNVRPFTLPIFKSDYLIDDFAVTGATNSMYALSNGAKDKTIFGIILRATATTNSVMLLSSYFACKNFEAETVCKFIEGSDIRVLMFRNLNPQNRIYVRMTSTLIELVKIVANVTTILQSISVGNTSKFNKYRIRAIGPIIEVFVDDKKIISISESDNINNTGFGFAAADAAIGVAQAEWQYIAIRPL